MRHQCDGSAQPQSSLRRRLIIGDGVAAFLTFAVALSTPGSKLADVVTHPTAMSIFWAVIGLASAVALTLAAMATQRLYLSRVSSMRTIEITRIARVSLLLGVAALVGGKLIGEAHVSRFPGLVVLGAFAFLNFGAWPSRCGCRMPVGMAQYVRPVILIGANDDAQNLYRLIKSHPELGYRIIGISGRGHDVAEHDFDDLPYLGDTAHLQDILTMTGVKGAIVAGGSLHRPVLNRVVRQLLENEVHVHMSTGINGIDHRRLRGQSLGL